MTSKQFFFVKIKFRTQVATFEKLLNIFLTPKL